MTSSLQSGFSPVARRIFYLDGRQLSVYESSHGVVQAGPVFQCGEQGLAAFDGYLRATASVAACLLVDVVDEEYRRETLPHVIGQDRQTLIKHRARRAFRDIPYWHAELQGREPGGRRDDVVLYTVLSNEAVLTPWLEVMGHHRVPLVGIYSLPLLSAGLLRHLDLASEHALLVSLQGPGRLRQSFFQGPHLKISRLAHLPAAQLPREVAAIVDEVEKLRRYLTSLRLLPRDTVLDVYLLGHGEMFTELQRDTLNTSLTRYHLIDTIALAWRLGMGDDFGLPYGERLFVQLLLRNRPANHYATSNQTHYYAMQRVRVAMLGASAVLFLGSVLWSALQLVDGLMYRERSAAVLQHTAFYSQRYQQARAAMPPVPVEPAELKRAVDTARVLVQRSLTPLPVMELFSQALAAYPALQIHELEWRVREEGADRDQAEGVGSGRGFVGTQRLRVPGSPGMRSEIAVLHGQIFPFDGDFRKALQMVNDFAQALSAGSSIKDVEVLSLPLNVSSTESLKGDVGSSPDASQARFSVRVGVDRGAS